ncbi:Oidioi.mRNA.OKI2018_I69.PAR.g9453.t1.cds [Oikopleura dioica]|uniref:Oidioi.mRNA.OKI2018_I69.PAR.g9453.t1.cds n=1 Tax=Oikopleura dioica TaxID=34765 RepID=A0ABN7RKP4_OIKDI|nr:Oidioi.mRNA.OKI2018_I69.PAR.g9453.t1.cds [Oikopleura dioica]
MFFPFFKGFSGPNRNNGRNGEGFPDQGRQQDDQSRNHSNPEGECTNPDDDFEFDVDIQKGRVRTNDRVIAILILLLFFYIVYENGRNRQRQREPRRIRMIRNPDRIEELESEDEMDITQRPAIEDHQAEVTFDIETMECPVNTTNKVTTIHAELRLLYFAALLQSFAPDM